MRICLSPVCPDAARQACPAFQHPVAAYSHTQVCCKGMLACRSFAHLLILGDVSICLSNTMRQFDVDYTQETLQGYGCATAETIRREAHQQPMLSCVLPDIRLRMHMLHMNVRGCIESVTSWLYSVTILPADVAVQELVGTHCRSSPSQRLCHVLLAS